MSSRVWNTAIARHTSRDVVDFGRSDFHAAIRFRPGPYAGMYAERLMGEWFVCPEAYLAMPKVAALRDGLRAEAAAFPLPPGQTRAP